MNNDRSWLGLVVIGSRLWGCLWVKEFFLGFWQEEDFLLKIVEVMIFLKRNYTSEKLDIELECIWIFENGGKVNN